MPLLPPEILLDVASHLVPAGPRSPRGRRDLASLARASRLLNAVAEAHLYHTVHLHGPRKLTSFLLALLSAPARGASVRDLTLVWSDGRTPLSHLGADSALRDALAGAFLAERQIALRRAHPRAPRRTPLVRPDPADDRLIAACVRHNLHPDLRRALAEDTSPPQIALLLRLLPPHSLPRLTLVGPQADSWLAESLLFPHVVSAGAAPGEPGCFRALRSLSVNFHHAPHPAHVLACLLLPDLEELELACVLDGRGDTWASSGVSAALRANAGGSSVQKLYLPGGALSGAALADVLGVPRALREFGYHRAGAWVVWGPEDWAAIAGAVRAQPALEAFELVEQCTSADDAPGTLGDALAGLTHLKRVHVPWRALVRPTDDGDDEDEGEGDGRGGEASGVAGDPAAQEERPRGLGALLPPTVESLVLRNDAGRDVRRRVRHVLDLLSRCRALRALHFDPALDPTVAPARRERERGEASALESACDGRKVLVGTSGISTWAWAFRPASGVLKLDSSQSFFC